MKLSSATFSHHPVSPAGKAASESWSQEHTSCHTSFAKGGWMLWTLASLAHWLSLKFGNPCLGGNSLSTGPCLESSSGLCPQTGSLQQGVVLPPLLWSSLLSCAQPPLTRPAALEFSLPCIEIFSLGLLIFSLFCAFLFLASSSYRGIHDPLRRVRDYIPLLSRPGKTYGK